jgi:hypothetical protein
MMKMRLLMLASTLAITAGGAFAHHGWGSYDASRVVVIESAVMHVAWQNPHVHIGVTHDGAAWELVLAPPFRMDARGLKPDMLKVGTKVRAEGYVSTRTDREMRAERIAIGNRSFELR